MPTRMPILAAVAGSTIFLFACGGGGGNGGVAAPPPAGGTVSGTVVKGPASGAAITAFAVTSGTMGAQIGGGTTDSMGNFTISIGDYTGPLTLQASGGTYTDEATGNVMTMQTGDAMASAIPSVAAGAVTRGIQITPLTSMAQARVHHMTGGLTPANIASANAAMGAYFSVGDILHTAPMNPVVAGSGTGASQDAKNYGMAIAAMSQYAMSIGMPHSSGIVTAMMDDALDGVMDGMMGSTAISMAGMGGMMGGMMQPTAGTSGLSTAMASFIGSAMNRSGVQMADMQALMNQLAGSDGQLPGAGGASTPSGTMAGTVFMGGTPSGTVTAYAVSDGMMGTQLGQSSVDGSGAFTIPLGAYAGTVMLQASGGSFMDEATGTTMAMQAGDVLTACVPSVAAGSTTTGVQVTPLTSMAQARAQGMVGGMTPANAEAANGAVGSYFMAGDILMTSPMDPAMAGSGTGAVQDARNYGMSIAAMSEYAKTLGMSVSSSGVVTAMMKDASDGVMNGMMGSTGISMGGMGGGMMSMMQASAGTTGLATAMTAFVGSSMNKSGVQAQDMQTLVDKLGTSNGTIQ